MPVIYFYTILCNMKSVNHAALNCKHVLCSTCMICWKQYDTIFRIMIIIIMTFLDLLYFPICMGIDSGFLFQHTLEYMRNVCSCLRVSLNKYTFLRWRKFCCAVLFVMFVNFVNYPEDMFFDVFFFHQIIWGKLFILCRVFRDHWLCANTHKHNV